MMIRNAILTVAAIVGVSATAQASVISSYTVNNAQASGFGGWTYTPTTLNDGIIPSDSTNDLLLVISDNPSIDFTLSSSQTISRIDILSNYLQNYIPGNLVSATVTIGGLSEVVTNIGYGTITDGGFPVNESLILSGPISTTPTTTFTLSNFVAQGSYAAYTALGEVVVNGGPAVPEPATWAMMLVGMGAIGFAMRRYNTVSAAYA